jgi:DMSO/TMAO reductase YedYZ molybdopterin-dependent catalytic subunit
MQYQGQKLSSVNDFIENSIKGPQYVDNTSYRLTLVNLQNETTVLTYDEVIGDHQVFQKVVTLYCIEGWNVTILWEGVLLKDLIAHIGVDPQVEIVKFFAYDGYSTSLPLDFLIENEILIAYKMNGVTLPPERGFPFQLVAEQQLGYKWIKWITRIELSDDVDFEGYWERRGYPNDADIDKYTPQRRGGGDLAEKP